MKYKVISETAIAIQGKRYEPGEELLTAPIHAKESLESGLLEVVPVAAKPKKSAKTAPTPEPTEPLNNA